MNRTKLISAAMICGGALFGCDGSATRRSDMRVSAAQTRAVANPDQVGPYAIGHTSYVLFDASRPGARPGDDTFTTRGRPIVVSVWYPVDPGSLTATSPLAVYPLDQLYGLAPETTSADWEAYGIDRAYEKVVASSARPFPLLVFSPGASFPDWGNTSLGTRLASHGFVVAVLYHFGSGWWPWEPLDHLAVQAYNRPRDMSFVLTDLAARDDDSANVLRGAIRMDQVAAGGWSLGGYAALVLGGARDESVCDVFAAEDFLGLWDGPPPDWTCAPSLPDPRFKAVVAIDGSSQVLHFRELALVTVPSIGIGEEWETIEAWFGPAFATWQARQHAALAGHPGYRVDVSRVIHPSFSDACEMGHLFIDKNIEAVVDRGLVFLQFFCGPDMLPAPEVHRIVSKYAIAFLQTDLAARSGYQHILTAGHALTHEPNAQFFVTEKKSAESITEDWPPASTYFQHQPGSPQAHAVKYPVGAPTPNRLGVR